ncbi:MAG TPA: BTAD domain-containing putative transcriptional regulator, partial [Gemmatimonadaceae bacterium]|nr:BTAD domain-containing putative transcriptional regulator [Gemmatimonadaceae bacterium]
ALFWPESDTESGRTVLRQTLYSLRRDLQEPELFLGSTELRLNSAVISSDVAEFEEATRRGDFQIAVVAYAGAFLEGVHIAGSREFEQWRDAERDRLLGVYRWVLDSLAASAEQASDLVAAARWWQLRANSDPLDARVAMRYMRALVALGDRAGAIKHADVYARLVREELGIEADEKILTLGRCLRAEATDRGEMVAAGVSPIRERPHEVERSNDAEIAAMTHAARAKLTRGEWLRRPILLAIAVAVAVIVGGGLWVAEARGPAKTQYDPNLVAVLPFRESVSDSSLGYLREGMVDLLSAAFGAEPGPRAAEPHAVMGAWRRHSVANEDERVAIADVARDLGAGRVLTGSIVGNADRIVITATLLQMPAGRVHTDASVEGPVDSLMALVELLEMRLQAREEGESETGLASLASHPLAAIKSYLCGRAAYRRGQFQVAVTCFENALQTDSTFALAAFDLALASGWAGRPKELGVNRAIALAWAGRQRFGPADRAFAEAFIRSSGYPSGGIPVHGLLTLW